MTRDRWQRLMTVLQLPENETTCSALLTAYREPHRFYHNVDHISSCLQLLDDVAHLAERPHEIELALWFHDAVYDPHSAANERDSADWAVRFLKDNAADHLLIQRIEALIMVTYGHAQTTSQDEDLMIDIDLSILGASPSAYAGFETAIRQEYAHVPPAIFCEKRSEILTGFLDRDRVFNTSYFADRFDIQARKNLSRAITTLAEQGTHP